MDALKIDHAEVLRCARYWDVDFAWRYFGSFDDLNTSTDELAIVENVVPLVDRIEKETGVTQWLLRARALEIQAVYKRNVGELAEADLLFREAEELLDRTELKTSRERAELYRKWSTVLAYQRRFAKAHHLLALTSDLLDSDRDPEAHGRLELFRGIAFAFEGKSEHALYHYSRALLKLEKDTIHHDAALNNWTQELTLLTTNTEELGKLANLLVAGRLSERSTYRAPARRYQAGRRKMTHHDAGKRWCLGLIQGRLGELTLARKQLLTAAEDFVVLGRPVFASAIYLDLIDILNRSKRIPSWKEIISMASTAMGLAGEASEECQRALRYIHVAAQARNREHLRCAYDDMRKKVV